MGWHRPADCFLKCNVDAALFSYSNSTGFGWVLRDSNGLFVACGVDMLSGLFTIRECEAIGLLRQETTFSVGFVWRQANEVAHMLARQSRISACPLFYDVLLSFLPIYLLNSCSIENH